jgi:Rhodopirellula transposase DDE domain
MAEARTQEFVLAEYSAIRSALEEAVRETRLLERFALIALGTIWQSSSGCRSTSVTSRPARASGTRSSTGCSPTSPVTGVARSLVSNEVIIALIANTTTQTGLKICAELDTGHYPTGLSVTDAELAALNLKRADFHGECNYTLLPLRRTK